MSDNRDDYIKLNALRVEALYSHSVIPVAVMLCGALILVFILWSKTNALPLLTWFFILLLVTIGRYINVFRYRVAEKIPEQYIHWLNRYFYGAVLSGMIWGSAAYVFITSNDIVNVGLLCMFMLVVAAGSIGIYSIFQRMYYGFNLPAIIPLVVYLLSNSDELLNSLGIILIIFVGFIFVIQYDAHNVVNQLLVIKFDNRHLLNGYEKDQRRIRDLQGLNNIKDVEIKKIRTELNNLKNTIEKLKKNSG